MFTLGHEQILNDKILNNKTENKVTYSKVNNYQRKLNIWRGSQLQEIFNEFMRYECNIDTHPSHHNNGYDEQFVLVDRCAIWFSLRESDSQYNVLEHRDCKHGIVLIATIRCGSCKLKRFKPGKLVNENEGNNLHGYHENQLE